MRKRGGWTAVALVLVGLTCLTSLTLNLSITTPARAAAAPATAPRHPQAEQPLVPTCPPDCGRSAAGDPLLVPYMVVNPGAGWLAEPDTVVEPYLQALRHSLSHRAPTTPFNVAAARWLWAEGGYRLQSVLVSSDSLQRVGLASPSHNAQNLCASSRGVSVGRLTPIEGIPNSVSGLCDVSPHASQFSTIIAFNQANVAVLMEIASSTQVPINPRIAYTAVQQQDLALPANGVVVSQGNDPVLIVFWALLAVAAVALIAHALRRHGVRGVAGIVAAALRRRWLALAVTIVGVVGAMAFSMLDSSLLHGSGQWFESGFNDFWQNWVDAGNLTFHGGFTHIYALDHSLETLPAFQVLTAPAARWSIGLPFPDPNVVLYPQAFWVAGPLFLATMALPICAGDRWLQVMGNTDQRRRLAVLAVMAITLPPVALFGHPEDLVSLGAVLYGLAAALDGRSRAAGCWFGVALAFQPFAALAVPLVLVLLKRGNWARAVVPMLLIPLAFLVVPLVGDPSATVHNLVHQTVYDDLGYISPTWNLAPGVGAFVRLAVLAASIPAALVVRRVLPDERADAARLLLWVVALLFALRVFEPELVPYFLAPTLALVPLCATRSRALRLAAACLVAVWLNWWVHFAVDAQWWRWIVLIGQLAVLLWLGWPGTRHAVAPTDSPSEPRQRPAPRPARRTTPAGAASR